MLVSTPFAIGDFTTDRRRLWATILQCVLIGIVAAFVAKALLLLIGLITHVAYEGRFALGLTQPDPRHWWPTSILIPVVGGLIVGAIARFGTEKVRGHGIPEAIQSILGGDSIIPARVAFFKPLASAVTIGTGGPFGAEGPIIMTGGAIGSLFAQFFRLTSFERRTLLVAGAAAGMSATFASPIAAVLIAVELLLFEWRPRSFIPVAVASFAAYLARIPLLGPAPPFLMSTAHVIAPHDYGWALAVGLAGGVTSMLMTRLVYLVEDAYHRLPVHWIWWPAIGGAIVGIGGWFVPSALGVGYPQIQALLNGRLAVELVVALIVVKILIWVASLSSGTSGGVLAPLLMIGGALGSICALVIPGHDSGAWAAVGMAAILGGTMRAPFMATVFTVETTHGWALMPAVFLGCIAATAFTVAFVPRSILTERLARRGMHVAREYSVHPLELIAIADVMVARDDVRALSAAQTIAAAAQALLQPDDPLLGTEFPVLGDDARTPVGIVSRDDILQQTRGGNAAATLGEIARTAVILHPQDRARHAADAMSKADARSVLVLDEAGDWVGMLTLDGLLAAWKRGLAAETRRKRVRSWRRPTLRRYAQPTTPS
ncbi:MAG TPA: chloride channel protein [Candidatus Baltobacteraceae bacterium]|nr:chloride channel protein [Candidatus Baltobacteraceae bacterium]